MKIDRHHEILPSKLFQKADTIKDKKGKLIYSVNFSHRQIKTDFL